MDPLPGNDLIVTGIEDLLHQRHTIPALLVAIGAPKLRSLGLEVPENLPSTSELWASTGNSQKHWQDFMISRIIMMN